MIGLQDQKIMHQYFSDLLFQSIAEQVEQSVTEAMSAESRVAEETRDVEIADIDRVKPAIELLPLLNANTSRIVLR